MINRDFCFFASIIGALMLAVMIAGNASIAIAQTSSGASGNGAAGTASAITTGSGLNVTGRVAGTIDPVGTSNAASALNDMKGHVSGAMVEGEPVKPDGAQTESGTWPRESNYWKNEYPKRSYYAPASDYKNYEPAYRFGFDTYSQNPGKRFDELDQLKLRSNWEAYRGTSTLNWDEAQAASRDAYNRMYDNRVNATGTVQ